jgi:hypothetical protein
MEVIPDNLVRLYRSKIKADVVTVNAIAIKFIELCKDYGYSKWVPPSSKDIAIVKKICRANGLDIHLMVERVIQGWQTFSYVKMHNRKIPDLSLFPRVYKESFNLEEVREDDTIEQL